ncbi:hypothetical protein OsJ_22341 [Oryza sativa Japonica Group]|uniref:Uncharacterized protein n=1 Tax=Oryza sativa subsp. japonica TaxID=39947 RepID=B9FQG7_ORYSJ|nr:hypothetical protein OsJ_22341 [Oryza sativa Japonica Group]
MVKAPKSAHVVKGVPAQAAVAAGDDDERELPLGGELLHPPQPLQEMGDSQDKEIQEGVQALLNNHGGDIEGGGVDPSNMLPDENGSASSTARKEGKRLTHHYLKFALLLVTISTVPLIDILFLRGDALKLPLGLKFASSFAFTAFVTAISLMFHTLKLMTIKPEHIISAINQLKLSIVLLATSISSLILSFISITCSLLPKAYYFLPISLVPSILVGVFHFIYNGKFDVRDVRPEESKALKKALKSANQLTLSLVTTSFSGFIGDLLGIYHKTEKLGVVAGAAAWAFIEFCTAAVGEEEEEDGKSELGTMYAIAVAVASVSFGAVLAVFGGLLGGAVGKAQLKVCTFFLTSAFVGAVSLGVVASVAPARKASVAVAAAVLSCCGLGTLVLAALALFYQIGA